MFDIEEIDAAINSGTIRFPPGLTREGRREHVRKELERLDMVLGYYGDGTPIKPIPPGSMATCACIFCKECRKMIRSMGGPGHDAVCINCWENK